MLYPCRVTGLQPVISAMKSWKPIPFTDCPFRIHSLLFVGEHDAEVRSFKT